MRHPPVARPASKFFCRIAAAPCCNAHAELRAPFEQAHRYEEKAMRKKKSRREGRHGVRKGHGGDHCRRRDADRKTRGRATRSLAPPTKVFGFA